MFLLILLSILVHSCYLLLYYEYYKNLDTSLMVKKYRLFSLHCIFRLIYLFLSISWFSCKSLPLQKKQNLITNKTVIL